SYNVYYNGWDRSDKAATFGVGIHHPSGDYMKISTFKKTATSHTWSSDNNVFGAIKAHWNVTFSATANGHGVTEGGSSGSPLFNQNKLIVGTLSGGNSTCKYPEGTNYYGKLYYHWDKYSKSDTARMDIYLDPIKSGVTQLAGRYASAPKAAPTNLNLTYKNQEVQLTWKAPDSEEKPVKYAVYRNNTFMDYSTTTSYSDQKPETGSQLYGVSAIYADEKESPTVHKSIYVYELKTPTDVTAKFNNNEVTVRWKAPIFNQMVYWGEGEAYQMISFGTDFYFGQRWEPVDLQPLHKNLIRKVLFLPTEGSTYSLLIKQGNRKYTQQLKNLVYEEINTIELKQPFTIDASKDLIVAFHAHPTKEDAYPAVIDEGPAIHEKGNLVSIDGETWEYYYQPPTDDFNFLLAAVITSEEGELTETKSAATSNAPLLLTQSTAQIRSAEMKTEESGNSSLRSIQTSAFPEITGYHVYRNNQQIGQVSQKSITEYIDKELPSTSVSYQVSTLYKENESPKSEATEEISVNNENISLSEVSIHPISFSSQVKINGHDKVHLLEIISVDGKQFLNQKHPESVIYTGSFPNGLYFFRLHTDQGIQIIKGIKSK
ncbi:MAG: protease, partial [Parabacteroides sp.]|nr:protease [Parabacteroides sp.]